MPAKSKKQQMMMAIAEHQPSKLYKRNRGVLKMSKSQMHEFASTKRKGLPRKKQSIRGGSEHTVMPRKMMKQHTCKIAGYNG